MKEGERGRKKTERRKEEGREKSQRERGEGSIRVRNDKKKENAGRKGRKITKILLNSESLT